MSYPVTLANMSNVVDAVRLVVREEIGAMPPEVVELEKLKRKEYLTEEEVSKLYNLSTATLRTKRSRGGGPPYVKDGERVLYPQKDVRAYLEARRVRVSS